MRSATQDHGLLQLDVTGRFIVHAARGELESASL
jgi:hypothetical protein